MNKNIIIEILYIVFYLEYLISYMLYHKRNDNVNNEHLFLNFL